MMAPVQVQLLLLIQEAGQEQVLDSGRNGTKSRDQGRAAHKGWNWITSVLDNRPEMVVSTASRTGPGVGTAGGTRCKVTMCKGRNWTTHRGIKWQEAAPGVVPNAGPSVGTVDRTRSRA